MYVEWTVDTDLDECGSMEKDVHVHVAYFGLHVHCKWLVYEQPTCMHAHTTSFTVI